MFYSDGKLQYPVRVETPDPRFARALQQAIGGIEGEIRVAMQYMFQAFGSRGPVKYRDMLLNTATEELGHIEMLATAVALNLENAPLSLQEEVSADPVGGSVLNGMNFRQILSTGLAALPVDADGIPFDMSHVYASGNIAADMLANATAESSGRVLACRLYNMTSDPGMKDMLSFLIARDTMHQQQWLAVVEELGGFNKNLPIPNDFPQEKEKGSSPTSISATWPTARSRKAAGRPAPRSTARAPSPPRSPRRWAKSRTSAPRVRCPGPRPTRRSDRQAAARLLTASVAISKDRSRAR